MLRGGVFRPVDDAQILPSPAFDGRLYQSLLAVADIVVRLDYQPLTAPTCQLFPPVDKRLYCGFIIQVYHPVGGCQHQLFITRTEVPDLLHVPLMRLVGMHRPFSG